MATNANDIMPPGFVAAVDPARGPDSTTIFAASNEDGKVSMVPLPYDDPSPGFLKALEQMDAMQRAMHQQMRIPSRQQYERDAGPFGARQRPYDDVVREARDQQAARALNDAFKVWPTPRPGEVIAIGHIPIPVETDQHGRLLGSIPDRIIIDDPHATDALTPFIEPQPVEDSPDSIAVSRAISRARGGSRICMVDRAKP